MATLQKLFEPIMIGKLELKNRIVMPAMCSKFGSEFGSVTDKLIDFYVERARGGVGLIIIENTCIDWPVGKAGTNPIRADEWKFVQGLHDLVEAVRPYGTRIATQLHHTGRQSSTIGSSEGSELVAPSPIPCPPVGGEIPRELTIEEIEALIGKYVFGAIISKTAGFDALEIQGAHGYLISQFMSPYSNKRIDEYGGDLKQRLTFPLKVVTGIRAAVGPDFPIIVRISGDEYIEGGLTIEDNKLIVRELELAGVDALSISAGIYESPPWYSCIYPPMGMPDGCNVHLAQQIKSVVNIPVIVAGKLGNPVLAETVLREGKADLIAMGRSLLADPDIVQKAAEGRLDDIRPCLYCNEACAGNIARMWRIGCQVNASLGREKEYRIRPAQHSKKVLIVGGGPAGMEAARVAALRGHEVVLYEKEQQLGGQLVPASVPPFKQPLKQQVDYLKKQVEKLGVNVELGTEATPELVREMKADVIILATGATPLTPDIQGIERECVVTATDILLGTRVAGNRVAIIGGGEVGSDIAWFLGEQGKKVTIIEMQFALAMDMNMFSRFYLTNKLDQLGIETLIGTTASEITDEGVTAVDMNGDKRLIEADTIVLAVGFKSNNELAERLSSLVPDFYTIGDCVKPGKIMGAIHSGARVARLI